jgi:hypothetical protein
LKLKNKELNEVLKLVSPSGIDYQAGRICRLLAQGENRTGVIASRCSVGNIPDVIAKNINPKIAPLGLFIACVKPPNVIRNKFDQRAGDWIYSFYNAKQKAANDPIYEQGSSVDDWQEQLKDLKLGGGD